MMSEVTARADVPANAQIKGRLRPSRPERVGTTNTVNIFAIEKIDTIKPASCPEAPRSAKSVGNHPTSIEKIEVFMKRDAATTQRGKLRATDPGSPRDPFTMSLLPLGSLTTINHTAEKLNATNPHDLSAPCQPPVASARYVVTPDASEAPRGKPIT